MSNAAPGWYADPAIPNHNRFWDGRRWVGAAVPVLGAAPYVPRPLDRVGFVEAVRRALEQYAGFTGRAGVAEYWWFVLFAILVVAVPWVVLSAMLSASDAGKPGSAGDGGSLVLAGLTLLVGLFALALVLPGLALSVRRLHDTDRSGWWVLLGLVPLGGFVLLFLMLQASDPHQNRYGNPAA